MSQSNFDRLLQKYLAGECTEEEEKLVLEWYEKLILNSDLHLSAADRSLIEDRLWKTIAANVQLPTTETPAPVKPLYARTWFRLSAAAALLIAIATAIALYQNEPAGNRQLVTIPLQEGFDSLANHTPATRIIQLSDSTQITLQPGAVVFYPPAFTGNTRNIYLKGSAFFNVSHNASKHFLVHLNDGLTTEVLGTSFHITQNSTDNNIEVAVVTGKVLVYRLQQEEKTTSDSNNRIVLTRNKKVTFNASSKQLITGIIDEPQPLTKTGVQQTTGKHTTGSPFNFEEAALADVLQTLSDAYGILILAESEQLANIHFTGDLSKYSLFTQLEFICKSTQTIYEINGTQIIIKDTRTGNL